MKLSTISESAWLWFKTNYPDAYSFLLKESLYGEWCGLRNRSILNEWEKTRLAELDYLLGREFRKMEEAAS